MCYYSSISVGFKIIETRFGVKFVQTESYQPVYSASASTFPLMPAITGENPGEAVLLQWGLIPFWVKDAATALDIRGRGLNARSETIFIKPMFRQAILTKRCLVVVDGFYEWRHLNNQRYPYYIRLADHAPFALAGLWDRWQDRNTGSEVRTFSIITTQANDLVAQIHNTRERMPVILDREDEKKWLDNTLGKAEIASLLKPYTSDLEAYPVAKSLSRLGFNTSDPAVREKYDYTDLPPLIHHSHPLDSGSETVMVEETEHPPKMDSK
jgi:putative SOS response-associated peptidase YedK